MEIEQFVMWGLSALIQGVKLHETFNITAIFMQMHISEAQKLIT